MKEIKRWLDLVYPPRCPVCKAFVDRGSGDDLICPECAEAFTRVAPPLCRRCGLPLNAGPPEERLCEACLLRPPAYEAARALYVYEGTAVEAVHRFKYSGVIRLAEVFGPMLARLALERLPGDMKRPLVMPVPLHLERLRRRGFNQSLLLARHVASLPGYELDYLALCRIRPTPSQSTLDRDLRRRNVKAAFEVRRPPAVKGRDVVLVDDVSTTGSTLDACSRALLKAGALRVYGLTMARAPAHRQDKQGS
jgi:ComF family protein